MTKVKGFGYHHDRVMDVADYVFPSQVRDHDNTRFEICKIWLGQLKVTTDKNKGVNNNHKGRQGNIP